MMTASSGASSVGFFNEIDLKSGAFTLQNATRDAALAAKGSNNFFNFAKPAPQASITSKVAAASQISASAPSTGSTLGFFNFGKKEETI